MESLRNHCTRRFPHQGWRSPRLTWLLCHYFCYCFFSESQISKGTGLQYKKTQRKNIQGLEVQSGEEGTLIYIFLVLLFRSVLYA